MPKEILESEKPNTSSDEQTTEIKSEDKIPQKVEPEQKSVASVSVDLIVQKTSAVPLSVKIKDEATSVKVETDSKIETSVLPPSVIPPVEKGTPLGRSPQEASSVLKSNDLSSISGGSLAPLDASEKLSGDVEELKSEEKVQANEKDATENLSTEIKKDLNLIPVKPVNENPIRSGQEKESLPVTMSTTQLLSRASTLENKLSVAVVSNSPPTVTTSTMNKSISPVIKAVSSSKPVDIVTSVSVPSTVTVTTNTTVSSTGGAIFTGSITLPIVTSVVRPSLPPVCCHTTMTSVSKIIPVTSANIAQVKKIPHQVDNTRLPLGSAQTPVNPPVVKTIVNKNILDVSTSVPVVTAKSKLLGTNAQNRSVSSIPMQAKVCIVTTVGNTKVAIHTLNSVAEPPSLQQITAPHRTILKPSIVQTSSRVQNAVAENVSKVGTGASIMIRDITSAADPKSDGGAVDSRLTKLDIPKPKVLAETTRIEETVHNTVLPKDIISHARQIEKIGAQTGKLIHSNLHHRTSLLPPCIPVLTSTVSKPLEIKETLHDQIDSIVNASRTANQNAAAAGHQKGVGTSTVSTTLQSKMTAMVNQPGASVVSSVELKQPQEVVGHAGRIISSQLVSNARSGQLPATSNLESGTATAAIQAVAAHVKATQSSTSHTPAISPPPPQPEHQKRQSKGISILKPLYDKEFELDDSEMDPKVNVPQIPIVPKKLNSESQSSSKAVENNASGPTSKTTHDTAFSIAQILDHAKRAMAEEKQQKESKASALKEKSKTGMGKGSKGPKPVKSQPSTKVAGQTTTTGPSPVAPDFPFGSNVHLSNFAQKSKQTPTSVNSTTNTPAHPIMSPEFHLNLTESVQKVMQAIPGSDALSPPPCPPKVVRPGSVYTKFNEDKQETNVSDTAASTRSTTPTSVSTPSTVVSSPVTVNISTPSDSVSPAPVTLHKINPNQSPATTSVISNLPPSLSPNTKTTNITSLHKSPTPPVAPSRNTPTPPSAMSALRNTPTPPAAVVPSSQQMMSRKTPTPPAATVPPAMVRKAPTSPAAVAQPHSNARVVSPHNIVNRHTPTPPFNRNTPTPPGTSTVIHSRSPHSTPPAKEIPKVKGPGVKFEIMSQPHGASTIVVIKSDNKDSTPPPTSDATQTIILGQKDIMRKSVVSSGKTDNVTVITTHKAEQLRKAAPTIIVPSSSPAANTSAMTMSNFSIQKQPTASVLTPKVQTQWKRSDVTIPAVRNVVPQAAQVTPRVTTVMKSVALQSRIGQTKPITAITVVNPMKQVFVGTNVSTMGTPTVATIGTPTTTNAIATNQKAAVNESNMPTKQVVPETVPTTSPLRLVVTTVKSPVLDINPPAVETEVSVVTSKEDDPQIAPPEVKQRKVEEVATLKTENVKVLPTTSQISPKIDSTDPETKTAAKRGSRKRSVEKEIDKIEVEQEQPNNNNKSEKVTKKSGDNSQASDETHRPARVGRRRSRESTESQQSTANSESGRSTRSSRRRGASESSDISISSDGHNTDLRSTASTRSSVDRSESPPRTASRHSTRSSTRKRTSAEREEVAAPSSGKSSTVEKERSVSPAPGKGTRASKRKLAVDDAADDTEIKKLKSDSTSADSKAGDTSESDTRSRRTTTKQDGKSSGSSNNKEPVTTSASRRGPGRPQKAENIEPIDDHTYSGTRRTNTRSSGQTANQDTKEEPVQKKATQAVKKGN